MDRVGDCPLVKQPTSYTAKAYRPAQGSSQVHTDLQAVVSHGHKAMADYFLLRPFHKLFGKELFLY
jgi:hypothetical protein